MNVKPASITVTTTLIASTWWAATPVNVIRGSKETVSFVRTQSRARMSHVVRMLSVWKATTWQRVGAWLDFQVRRSPIQ